MKKTTLFLTVCLLVAFFSCKPSNKTEETEEVNEFVQNLTKQDTLDIEDLINKYISFIQEGQFGAAAAMLYTPDTADVWNEPHELDNEELQEVAKALSEIPVQDFSIDSLHFNSAVENEVFCTIIIEEGNEEEPPVTTHWAFCPMNYLGKWILCLKE
jgi:hypothetical protein